VKPENILITASGNIKIIDFGAAADMCVGASYF
jgi:serine/threonine protein kinase